MVEVFGITMLKPKFEMEEGCVIGDLCALCNDTSTGCGTKNVIYNTPSACLHWIMNRME